MEVFFDMKELSQIPTIVEPLFLQLNAKIELLPAMNLDDLTAGLKQAEESRVTRSGAAQGGPPV
jgi:hypothetical protein